MQQSGKLILALSLLWAMVVLALGGWWLYLISRFGEQFERLSKLDPSLGDGPNIAALVKWEGGTFIVLLLLISGTLLYQYLKDRRKSRDLQSFYAAMTHELKTPLASVRLQAEVIYDLLIKKQYQRISNLAERFIEDTQRWETQTDKILQLSRVERQGNLSPESIHPIEFLNNCKNKWAKDLEITTVAPECPLIWADAFALELVFRNLFENTKTHTDSTKVKVICSKGDNHLHICYRDGGVFSGDTDKLGSLFYKHNSRGSGIGLYLINKLLSRMGGEFEIIQVPYLSFCLSLPLSTEDHLRGDV